MRFGLASNPPTSREMNMSNQLGSMIAANGDLCLGYAERLLKDIPLADFARFATLRGQVIESNHPAFIVGHLSLYGHSVVEHLGGPAAADSIPAGFEELFSKNATCQNDLDGTLYPDAEMVCDTFYGGYRQAVIALRASDDGAFAKDNPAQGPIKERFPTLGGMLSFYMSGHMMVHLGQLSAFRRMIGLGSA
jgi:hypothetical protein